MSNKSETIIVMIPVGYLNSQGLAQDLIGLIFKDIIALNKHVENQLKVEDGEDEPEARVQFYNIADFCYEVNKGMDVITEHWIGYVTVLNE